jgi:hypothetical protein
MVAMNQFKLTRHSRLQGRRAAKITTTQSRRILFRIHAHFRERADARAFKQFIVFLKIRFCCAMYMKLWKNVRRLAAHRRFIHQETTATIK